jgi:hydrogenase maturation protease
LGIGNLIMTDDGVGVKVIHHLSARYQFTGDVELLDGGTLGLDLLPYLEGIDRLLIVDAIETGKAPGTLARLVGDEIPVVMETKLSPHQMGLKDLLAVAMLQGFRPPEMVLLGIQPENIDLGMELSPKVSARFEDLVQMAIRELENWGIRVEPVAKASLKSQLNTK